MKFYLGGMYMIEKTCCFFGHKDINETEELRAAVEKTIEELITKIGVDTFLFGSNSRFDSLCYEIVSALKEKHPHVKRIYVRAEYPYINESYEQMLLRAYEESYFPEKIIGAGRAAYVERNREMIDKSRYCVIYYDENYVPKARKRKPNPMLNYSDTRKSGTKLALDYAESKKREIFRFCAV